MIGEEREGRLQRIPVGRIRPPGRPLRRPPEPAELQRLAASIRRHGLLHPILVRPSGKVFEIVSGLRRYLACRQLGMGEVLAVVRPLDDRQAVEVALAENARREPFSLAERADLLRRLEELFPARPAKELEEWLGPLPEAEAPAAAAMPAVEGLKISLPDWMDAAASEGETVVIPAPAEKAAAPAPGAPGLPAAPPPAERKWLIPVTTIVLKELKATGELDVAFVRKIVGELFDMFDRLPPVEFLDLRYLDPGRRLARHCINVAKLAMFLARELGLGRDEIEQAAICGILHDAGMAREKEAILAGSPPEEQEEWKRTKGHPAGGQVLLTKEAVLRNVVARVAPEHAGGPDEGKKERVHLYARLVNVVDTYEALVSMRAGRTPELPFKAMHQVMDAGAQGMLDWDLVRLFVRAVSVYPVGSYVKLEGGEMARVVRANAEMPEKPVIAVLTDAQGAVLEEPVELDLAMAEPPPFAAVAGPG
jgi:hypothetical protein